MLSNVGSSLVEAYEYGTRIHEILISKPISLIIHVPDNSVNSSAYVNSSCLIEKQNQFIAIYIRISQISYKFSVEYRISIKINCLIRIKKILIFFFRFLNIRLNKIIQLLLQCWMYTKRIESRTLRKYFITKHLSNILNYL